MTPADWIALVNAALTASETAATAYQQLRDAASKNGVTDDMLAESDARFRKVYADPLAIASPPAKP